MREVKRMAKVGEKVKVVDADFVPKTGGNPEYKNGDILTVIGIYHDSQVRYAEGMSDDRRARVLNPEEYVVLEGENEMRFKVGDVVKIASCKHGHGFRIGERVRIVKATDTDYYAELIENGEGWWIEDDEIQPAPFTLSDLKPCMATKDRCGTVYVITMTKLGMCAVDSNGCYIRLEDLNNDMTSRFQNRHLDFVEVYDFSNVMAQSADIALGNRNLIWKREEPKPKRKMTVAEICKELGEEIEIVKGE